MNKKNDERPELEKSEIVEALPLACADETAAVEFFEEQRWGDKPTCPHCDDANVYKLKGRNGQRNVRYLWRCRACGEQYTVRIKTVYEDSRLPLRHWAYAFWRACTSKKGVAALEIQRQCQISYKSALFLMHRVRFALTDVPKKGDKLGGSEIIEIDETYCGGKPRPSNNQPRGSYDKRKWDSAYANKTPIVAMVERGGKVRTKVIPNVTQKNVYGFLRENICEGSVINTDQSSVYKALWPIIQHPKARHDVVNHSKREYARHNADGTVSHVNCAESFFSLIKRGLMGTFHAVSKEHLHRYANEFAFRWDTRELNDGQRIAEAIQRSLGKRLEYEDYVCR